MNANQLPITERTRIRRLPDHQSVDRTLLYRILDEGLVAHVSLLRGEGENAHPVVLPMGYARDGDTLLFHGSSGSDLMRAAADGRPIAVAVTHLDGLVFARSLFDSSMNYRSAMVLGVAQVVPADEKVRALIVLSDHLMPGRSAEVRDMTRKEIAATMVLRLPLSEVSVKVGEGGPSEDTEDGESRQVWAGVLPLTVSVGQPQSSSQTPESVQVPRSVQLLLSRDHQNTLPSPRV